MVEKVSEHPKMFYKLIRSILLVQENFARLNNSEEGIIGVDKESCKEVYVEF